MIKDRLTKLAALIQQDPTSPEVVKLASAIKDECKSDEDRRMVDDFVGEHLTKLTTDIEELHDEAIKLQLSEVSDMINLSYIAKTYFKKSRAWLSQRINGNSVNNKPCRFTSDELATLNHALSDMALKLSTTTVKY